MKVGGIVIEVIVINEHKYWVNTKELKLGYERAIFCDPLKYRIDVGDTILWEPDYSGCYLDGRWHKTSTICCYWTPGPLRKNLSRWKDIKLPKIGYSGVSRMEALSGYMDQQREIAQEENKMTSSSTTGDPISQRVQCANCGMIYQRDGLVDRCLNCGSNAADPIHYTPNNPWINPKEYPGNWRKWDKGDNIGDDPCTGCSNRGKGPCWCTIGTPKVTS